MEGAIFMSRAKIDYEEKVRIVQEYQSGKVGFRDSVKAANNSKRSFRQWIAQYKVGGATALLPRSKNTIYAPELKMAATKAYLAGKGSLENVCRNFQINDINRLRGWIKEYNAHGDFNSVKFSGGGSYMKQGRNTTVEERIEIVKECIESGKNYGEMALKYNVSYQQART